MDDIGYVEKDLIPNCPVMKEEIICVKEILEPNLVSLKGKTAHKTPERVVLNALDNLPNRMLDEYGDVTIAIIFMYINEILFVMTTS
jgi:hypothetical protein